MQIQPLTRAAVLTLVLGGFACAGNKSNNEVGAARDSSMTAKLDSTKNQTESGVTDSTGQSTLGDSVERTRPDQGQPVTSKGDTVNKGIDSSTTARDSSSNR
jgi:hypothetical protein